MSIFNKIKKIVKPSFSQNITPVPFKFVGTMADLNNADDHRVWETGEYIDNRSPFYPDTLNPRPTIKD